MRFLIREASEEDLEDVYRIESSSFKEPYQTGLLKTLQGMDCSIFLLAKRDGDTLGYVIATHRVGRGHLLSIAVRPSVRRRGVGSRLVVEALNTLNKLGVTIVRLEVRKSNKSAQNFYRKLGFEQSHIIDGYYTDEDGLVYYKSL